MSDADRFFLGLHVPAAAVALVGFWGAVVARKGGRPHRTFGGLFWISMGITAATAAVLCVLLLVDPLAARPPGPEVAPEEYAEYGAIARAIGSNLLEQALLTASLLHFGWSALRRKRRARSRDVVLAAAAPLTGLGLLLAGLDGIVLVVVGALELRSLLRRPRPPWAWLVEHLVGFLGAGGIANAALAVNLASHFTEDLGRQFALGGLVGLGFVVALIVVARGVRRSAERGAQPLASGVTPHASEA